VKETILAVLIALISSIRVVAQDQPRIQVFAGYSLESIIPCGTGCRPAGESFPLTNFNGWNASVTGYLYKSLGVTADFTGHYASHIVYDPVVGGHRYSYMFGPSYAFRGSVGSLFLHALFGEISQGSDQLSNMNFMKFAWGFGGGLDVNITSRLSMRPIELDYERTKVPVYGFAPGATQTVTGLRYAGGVVIKF